MREYYDTIPDFKEYVDKYAAKHYLTVDEALEHAVIKNYLQFYLYNNKCL